MLSDDHGVVAIRRALRFAFAVLLRALAAIAGAVTAYGATGMFTSAGVQRPNAIVFAGLAMCALTVVWLWVRERRLVGIWPALWLIGVPNALYAFGSWSTAECLPDHPPVTPTFSCSPVGTHAIAIAAPILGLIALILFVRDVRALTRPAT